MKERPILFSAPMVRALLDGTKTQTRRIVKLTDSGRVKEPGSPRNWHPEDPYASAACPYGAPGDTLWVKETWNSSNQWNVMKPTDMPEGAPIFYGADYDAAGLRNCGPWRPSLFMRRWMSRITLEVASVRVERLHAITEADAKAEGVEQWNDGAWYCGVQGFMGYESPVGAYRELWESINAKRAPWASNPWVWVVEFRRVEGGAK
jgi:hypothetical protein